MPPGIAKPVGSAQKAPSPVSPAVMPAPPRSKPPSPGYLSFNIKRSFRKSEAESDSDFEPEAEGKKKRKASKKEKKVKRQKSEKDEKSPMKTGKVRLSGQFLLILKDTRL